MNKSHEFTDQQQLPPWSKKRRIITSVLLTGFILVASIFLGTGVYQILQQNGYVQEGFSKKLIAKELLDDADFLRAVNKNAKTRPCVNEEMDFAYEYQPPFTVLSTEGVDACLQLVALHQTGADSLITIWENELSREQVVEQEVESFRNVDTQILNNTTSTVSELHGIRDGVETIIYVVGVDRNKSYTISYSPVNPSLAAIVYQIATSFQFN